MPHVLLINPSPRKGKRIMATRKKARTAKQKAATRRLVALNRARSRPAAAAPKRRRPKMSSRRPNPAPRKRSKRRTGTWPITTAKAASRAGRRLRHRRPNPIDFLTNTLMPSVVGGAGALALDVAFGLLPLPENLRSGPMAPLVKIAGAVGLGMLASKMVSRRVGEQVAAGAITVQVYNFAKATLIRVGGGKIPGLSMYPEGVGDYVDGDPEALGYTDSGMQVGDMSMAGYETGVYR